MKKQIIALSLLAGVVGTTGLSYAYDRGNENRAAMEAVVESGTYADFVTAVSENGNTEILDKITEENFARFQEMHTYMTKAREIQDELGLGGKGNMREGGSEGMGQKNEEVSAAIESGDYDAFVDLLPEDVAADMTEEKFALVQQMHTARAEGDYETAQALREELGMGKEMRGGGQGMGRGRGRATIDTETE